MDPSVPRLALPQPWPIVVDSLCSGIIGGLASLFVTYLIEEFGGVVGGILGTIPASVVVSALGLFFLEKPDKLDISMNTVPVGMLLCLVILLLWRLLPERIPRYFVSEQRLVIMVSVSLIVWILLAYAMVELLQDLVPKFDENSDQLQILGLVCLAFYFIIAAIVVFIPVLPVSRKGDESVSKLNYFGRFSAGFVSTVCVVVLGYWNEYTGGIVLAFPSVILTSLTSIWMTQSETVATSSASPLILGSTTNSIFAMSFAFFSPILEKRFNSVIGLILSVLCSWFICVYLFTLPMVFILRKKELMSVENVPPIRWSEAEDNNTSWSESSALTLSHKKKTDIQ